MNASGTVGFSASYTPTSIQGVLGSGVLRGNGSSVVEFVHNGLLPPEGNGYFDGFANYGINDAGQMLFRGNLGGASGGGDDDTGFYRGDGVGIVRIVRQGQAVPVGGGKFDFLDTNPAMNNLGQVAFGSSLIDTAQNNGMFLGSGGAITQIARRGQAVPLGVGTFSSFGSPAINDAGQVAFIAFTEGAGVTSSNDGGLFLYDSVAGIVKVAREGDSLLGSTITKVQFAESGRNNVDGLRGLNELGQVAYDFTLADGRRGIAIGTVVALPTFDADFDNDSDVDGRDFLIWQRGNGRTGAAATNEAGNADGDSDIDGADLTAWRSRFGAAPSTAAVSAVPEPNSLAHLGLGLFVPGLLGRLRRKTFEDMARGCAGVESGARFSFRVPWAAVMFRSFGVVPAAGLSARMGAAKLLLPLGGRTIIERVLASWTASGVTRTVVVVRPGDAALVERCRQLDVDVVVPRRAPIDMKASVAAAIEHIEAAYAPAASDAWLLAPADTPRLSAQAIDAVLAAYDSAHPTAVAPTFEGLRGHPLLLPWMSAADVRRLGPDEGVNALVARLPVREVEWCDASIVRDLDTPAEYALLETEAVCPAFD